MGLQRCSDFDLGWCCDQFIRVFAPGEVPKHGIRQSEDRLYRLGVDGCWYAWNYAEALGRSSATTSRYTSTSAAGYRKCAYAMTAGMATVLHANLQKQGTKLHVYNRTESKAKTLIKDGAIWEESPAEIAKTCDVTFSSLYADDALISTFKAWLSGSPKKGSIYVDSSTVYPGTVKQLTADATEAGAIFCSLQLC